MMIGFNDDGNDTLTRLVAQEPHKNLMLVSYAMDLTALRHLNGYQFQQFWKFKLPPSVPQSLTKSVSLTPRIQSSSHIRWYQPGCMHSYIWPTCTTISDFPSPGSYVIPIIFEHRQGQAKLLNTPVWSLARTIHVTISALIKDIEQNQVKTNFIGKRFILSVLSTSQLQCPEPKDQWMFWCALHWHELELLSLLGKCTVEQWVIIIKKPWPIRFAPVSTCS